MYSLFKVNFNWVLYIGIIFFIRFAWMDLSWYGFFALCITVHQFLLLFYSIGSIMPIRYLLGAFMCLQMFVGPTLAYHGLDVYQHEVYQMKVSQEVYYTYVIPAISLFILGLHVTAQKFKGEIINRNSVSEFVDRAGDMPYYFVGIGFLSSIIAGYFSSAFGFVFYLLGSFKFIGTFMILLGSRKLKPIMMVIVFGSVVSSSLIGAMFHDLLTWLIMLGAVLAIKYQPSVLLKAGAAFGFILLAIIIQQLKGEYRKEAWGGGETGLGTFGKLYEKQQEERGFFSFESMASSNVRINQGFIITNIMNTVPNKVPFENGAELLKILEAAFLPRILAPNKLNAGDRTIFMKYSGMFLAAGTSMGLSSVGDGYINFGVMGGSIFMFFLGLLFSEVLNSFNKYSKYYPILLLFTPLVFYYPMRPDCELQTSLGHLVKSCFLIFLIIQIWKHRFIKLKIKIVSRATA